MQTNAQYQLMNSASKQPYTYTHRGPKVNRFTMKREHQVFKQIIENQHVVVLYFYQ